MKQLLIVTLVGLMAASAAVAADRIITVNRPTGAPSFLGYVPDRFIVVMKPEIGKLQTRMSANAVVHIGDAEFDAISDRFAVSRIEKQFAGSQPGPSSKSAELAKYHKITFNSGTLEEAMEAYRGHPLVEHVEPIGIHTTYATPSDFYYSYQWHLNQANDHDIDAPEAWDIEVGADATVVAILDTGTRYYHPDLGGVNASPSNPGASRGNMWINDAELNGSAGVDDDGNGYVDDWIGYDFIQSTTSCWPGEDCGTQDNDPRDFNGHGTHTAGIFGMITNDGYGMCGVAGGWGNGTQTEYANGVRIMPLRMGYSYSYLGLFELGVVLMDAAAEAFYYAADNGATIASCSWGSSNSGGIGAAANYFLNSGGIIVVAAGNDGVETAPDYLNGRGDCISVAATDENDNGASFTTYGTWVDICAPGNNIYSTYHDHTDPATNYWAALGGTSMATPMVAGVCALIWSQNPGWTASQVENQLYSSADNIDAYLAPQYIGKMGAGRINAYNAVNTGPPPPPVADFSGSPTSGTEPLTVAFTDLSTGSIDSWSWNFGDGGNSAAQNPSHEYTAAGTYTVSLTVTGPGGSDSEVKVDYITVNPCVAPVADFSGTPTSGEAPLAVDFTDLSTGSPISWDWNFGDGGTSNEQHPSYTYTSAGTYTVMLTATNSCGSDGETKIDYITVTEPVCTLSVPVADFSGSPTSGDVPLTVSFSDLSSNSPDTWSWDFGDGGSSSAQNPAHQYNDTGTFTVSLTASNCAGSDAATKVGYITVTAPPVVMEMYVFDIVVTRIDFARGGVRKGLAVVTVYDNSNQPLGGATVTGDFSGELVESGATGITDASGQATILTDGTVKGGRGDICFEVTDVTHSSYTYNSALNNVTQSCQKSGDIYSRGDPDLLTLPADHVLDQNHPNPFNPATNISFNLPSATYLTLAVYNVLGQQVAVLAEGQYSAGQHTVSWDATSYPSGIYFYRLQAQGFVETKKMLLLK